MKLKKVVTLLMVIVMLVFMFAGCSKETDKSQETNDTVDTTESTDEVVNIRVGAMPYYLSVPLQVIKDEQLDEKYGFKLEVINFPSGGPMAEALGAGQWDIGPIGAGGMIAVPTYNAKLIADVEATMDGAWIVARPDSDIVKAGSSIENLPEVLGSADTIKGKTMLGTIGNISHYMGLDYISQFGLGMQDINFIHMETAQVYTSFVAGNGDIACLGSPSAALKLKEEGYPVIGGLKQQDISQQDAILVSEDFYANNYNAAVRFMKAWYSATDMLNANEDYEVEMTMKFYGENGRTDFTEDSVRQECQMNTYVDSTTVFDKEVGKWMTGLVAFMVENGSMEQEVLDAMKTNVKLDVVKDAIKELEAEK